MLRSCKYTITVVPLLKVTLTRGHPSYEARIFCPHYYKVNRFLPLAKGHLSYVATMCSQIGWPYKRGTTVFKLEVMEIYIRGDVPVATSSYMQIWDLLVACFQTSIQPKMQIHVHLEVDFAGNCEGMHMQLYILY